MDRNHEIWDKSGQHYVKASDWRYLSDLSGQNPFGGMTNQLDASHPYTVTHYYWHHLRFFHPERIRSYFQINLSNQNMAQSHSYRNCHCHVGRWLPGKAQKRAYRCATNMYVFDNSDLNAAIKWEQKQQITCLDEDAIVTRALFVLICSELTILTIWRWALALPPPTHNTPLRLHKMNWSTKKRWNDSKGGWKTKGPPWIHTQLPFGDGLSCFFSFLLSFQNIPGPSINITESITSSLQTLKLKCMNEQIVSLSRLFTRTYVCMGG